MATLEGFCDSVRDRKVNAEARGLRMSRIILCPEWELKLMAGIMSAIPMPDGSYAIETYTRSMSQPQQQVLCSIYGVPVVSDHRIKNDMWFMYERKK